MNDLVNKSCLYSHLGKSVKSHPVAGTVEERCQNALSHIRKVGTVGLRMGCLVGEEMHRTLKKREREMFYLTTHSTHFIYSYMVSDIWLRTILIVRKETRCRHIGYSYQLTARVLLYAPSHRQDNTYHGLCYTSRGSLAGTRNSSMGS